jgi:hypothetical protein
MEPRKVILMSTEEVQKTARSVEDMFDLLAKAAMQVPDENKIKAEDFKEAFRQTNKAVKEVKEYHISLDGEDHDVEADEFFISQGVMFFKKEEEFVFMCGIGNLISINIEEV